ncbi:MAG: hypothetical protein EBZ13_02840 [Planctomycetia bacterium]|nr:hypothetical protein [Planctomycetia bacterium]
MFPAVEGEPDERCDGDDVGACDDHLENMHDLLERMEEQDLAAFLDDGTRSLRFDLCEGCRQRFLRNPLGAKPNKSFSFSQN